MTSVNLAITMALTGVKVILIDADLRRPMIATVFGAAARSNGFGLLLLGNAPPELALLPAPGSPNLQLLLANPEHAHLVDLLQRDRLETVLEQLQDYADVIIIDSPPLTEVADALPLADVVDTILVDGASGPEPPRQARRAAARAGAARRLARGLRRHEPPGGPPACLRLRVPERRGSLDEYRRDRRASHEGRSRPGRVAAERTDEHTRARHRRPVWIGSAATDVARRLRTRRRVDRRGGRAFADAGAGGSRGHCVRRGRVPEPPGRACVLRRPDLLRPAARLADQRADAAQGGGLRAGDRLVHCARRPPRHDAAALPRPPVARVRDRLLPHLVVRVGALGRGSQLRALRDLRASCRTQSCSSSSSARSRSASTCSGWSGPTSAGPS